MQARRVEHRRNQGAALVLVLIAVSIGVVLGLTFLAVSSTSRATTYVVADSARAQAVAESGLAAGLAIVSKDNTWRTGAQPGPWLVDVPCGAGTFTVSLYDGVDKNGDGTIDSTGSLSNNADPVTLQSVGTVNGASVMVQNFYIPKNTAPAVISLSGTTNKAITVSGGSTLNITTLQVNSNGNPALWVSSGSSSVHATAINVVGKAAFTGGATYTGTLTTGVAPVSDPLASLPAPTPGTDQGSVSISSGSVTYDAGYYSGGITVSGGNVTLSPGIYILGSKGLTIKAGTVNASGVIFYLMGSTSTVTIQTAGNLVQTPPTSGTYQGISWFQQRGTIAASNVSGGGIVNIGGTAYLPSSAVVISGGSNGEFATQLIANTITVSGGGTLTIGH